MLVSQSAPRDSPLEDRVLGHRSRKSRLCQKGGARMPLTLCAALSEGEGRGYRLRCARLCQREGENTAYVVRGSVRGGGARIPLTLCAALSEGEDRLRCARLCQKGLCARTATNSFPSPCRTLPLPSGSPTWCRSRCTVSRDRGSRLRRFSRTSDTRRARPPSGNCSSRVRVRRQMGWHAGQRSAWR